MIVMAGAMPVPAPEQRGEAVRLGEGDRGVVEVGEEIAPAAGRAGGVGVAGVDEVHRREQHLQGAAEVLGDGGHRVRRGTG